MALVVKNLPANAGDEGSVLGQEDPLEEEIATHSSILAWRIPWTEEPGRLRSRGSQESDTTELLYCLKVGEREVVLSQRRRQTWNFYLM